MAERIADDALDYRDAETLWFHPDGYEAGTVYELSRDEVKEMLAGFDQDFASDTILKKFIKRIRRMFGG